MLKEFIIGTENSIVQHLQYECPDKKFYPLSKDCVCHNMKLTTLMDVYNCVCGQGGEEIKLDDDVREKAKACIDTMLTLGEQKIYTVQFTGMIFQTRSKHVMRSFLYFMMFAYGDMLI